MIVVFVFFICPFFQCKNKTNKKERKKERKKRIIDSFFFERRIHDSDYLNISSFDPNVFFF